MVRSRRQAASDPVAKQRRRRRPAPCLAEEKEQIVTGGVPSAALHAAAGAELHWAIQDSAERRETLFCCYLDFENAFNSPDHAALWRWLQELNVPDIDLLQSLYSGAYYQADLPYGRSAEIAW